MDQHRPPLLVSGLAVFAFGNKTARFSPMFRKKRKKGIRLHIPGFGHRHIHTLLSDYDGTLSCNGKVETILKDQLVRLADLVEIPSPDNLRTFRLLIVSNSKHQPGGHMRTPMEFLRDKNRKSTR